MSSLGLGGVYEVHASVLRGSGLCGGSLGFPATAGGGSCVAATFFRSSLEILGARPVARPFRQRAPSLPFLRGRASTKVYLGYLRFAICSRYNFGENRRAR